MKRIILLTLILIGMQTGLYAGRLTQTEYNAAKTQFRKYCAGSYFFGADTTTAKTDYGVWISTDGILGVNKIKLYEAAGEQYLSFWEVLSLYSDEGSKRIASFADPIYFYTGLELEKTLWVGGNITAKQNILMDAGKTVDGRDVSVDGGILDGLNAATTQYMLYSEYDADNDGYVNKADSATYSDSTGNYTPAGDLNMNGYRIIGSSTIPYSPTSETLVTAKYVEDNSNFETLFIGTTTKQTSSTTFVPLLTTSSITWKTTGYHDCFFWGDFYIDTNKATMDIEVICSTDNFVSWNVLSATSKYLEKAGYVNIDLRVFAKGDFFEEGKQIKIRIEWKTDLGTISNYVNGTKSPRVLRHTRHVNKFLITEEEQ